MLKVEEEKERKEELPLIQSTRQAGHPAALAGVQDKPLPQEAWKELLEGVC